MSTRAQIAIQFGPAEWAHVYVHFDGYPAHMLPVLTRWKPEDVFNPTEIRQVTPEALDCFSPPRDARILPRPTREFAHLYMWIGCQWVHVVPRADAPELHQRRQPVMFLGLTRPQWGHGLSSLRKSIGLVATIIRTRLDGKITSSPAGLPPVPQPGGGRSLRPTEG